MQESEDDEASQSDGSALDHALREDVSEDELDPDEMTYEAWLSLLVSRHYSLVLTLCCVHRSCRHSQTLWAL